jgi:hypothetical protein
MPALSEDLINVCLLEFNRYIESRWVMQDRICAHKEAKIRINTKEQGGIQAIRVLPEVVKLLVIRPILKLKSVFILGAVLGLLVVGQKHVSKDS